MNWAKENKSLAGIVGIMVVGALGLGAWLYLTWSGYAASMEQWSAADRQIATLRSSKLFPSEANVESREKAVTEYADKVNLLRNALLSEKVQQAVKPMSQTEFQAKLKDRANAMKKLSSTVMSPPLADDFALGFDEYSNTVPRTAEVAAELNVHLDVMEKLVTTIIQAGVTSIDMLERTKLPNESAAPAPQAAPVTKRPVVSKGKSKSKKPLITAEAAAEPVLDRYPIKIILTTDQGPFQNVMNTLCHPGKMPHFLVVRQVRVENTRIDGPSKEEVASRRSKPPQASEPSAPEPSPAAAAGAPRSIAAPKPAAPDAFAIMGQEPIKVYLEVDYIRFRSPVVEEEEPAAPAKP